VKVDHHLGVEIVDKGELAPHCAREFHGFSPQVFTCLIVLNESHSFLSMFFTRRLRSRNVKKGWGFLPTLSFRRSSS